MVDAQQMEALPLILRDPYQLILLSPGTTQTNSGLGGFSINGGRERNNNFELDGTNNNDPGVPGSGLVTLNPDATEEFRVITDNYLPEFGRNSSAVIDIVTRSGTNHLHGDVYYFGRWNALGARDFFNTAATGKQSPYVRNTFGASIGARSSRTRCSSSSTTKEIGSLRPRPRMRLSRMRLSRLAFLRRCLRIP